MRPADNPFAVQRLARLTPRLPAGWTWETVLARCAELDYRAALVGPEGHGKSTLLRALAQRLAAAGWRIRRHQLHHGDRRLPADARTALLHGLGPKDLVLLDGAEQLSWLSWHLLRPATRHAGGLLVTSHRPGLLPTLFDCPSSPELLADLVNELLAGASAAPAATEGTARSSRAAGLAVAPGSAVKPAATSRSRRLDLPSAAQLFLEHHGNLRNALLYLYDRWARSEA